MLIPRIVVAMWCLSFQFTGVTRLPQIYVPVSPLHFICRVQCKVINNALIDPCLPGAWQVRRELAHIQRQGHINHAQEIYCVKLASSVSMLDADRVCSSDRGVVSHLSMPPLVLMLSASNLFFSPSPLFLLPFTYFGEIKISPCCDPDPHILGQNWSLVTFEIALVKHCRLSGRRPCCLLLLFFFISSSNLTGNMFHWWENRKRQVRRKTGKRQRIVSTN